MKFFSRFTADVIQFAIEAVLSPLKYDGPVASVPRQFQIQLRSDRDIKATTEKGLLQRDETR